MKHRTPANKPATATYPTGSQLFARTLISNLAEAGAGHAAEWVAVASRFPHECRELFVACYKLSVFNEDCCNGSGLTEEAEGDAQAEMREAVCEAAGKLIGTDCTVTFQTDPRGLPVYLAWAGMNDRLRCAWVPERGMPVLYSRELLRDYVDAFDYEV